MRTKPSIKHVTSALALLAVCLIVTVVSTAQADPIKLRVGVISGLTGAAAKWCTFQNMGMQLAQEELQHEGVQIELIFEDSQTLPSKVIAAYYKLVGLDHVDAVLADDFGFVVAPLLPIVERQKQLLLTLSLADEKYCKTAPTQFFSIASLLRNSQDAYDRFFALNPQIKRIGLIAFDDPEWGNLYLGIWREIASKRGLTIVDTFLSSDLHPDFKSALTRMRPKKPDAILFAHEPEALLKTVSQLRVGALLLSANNALEMVAARNSVPPELDGVYVVDPAISEEFRRKFFERFKRQPILEAYSGYESIRTLALAAKTNRSNLAAGMRTVRYEGTAGLVDFTQGNCAGNLASWKLYRFSQGRQMEQ